MPNLNNLIAGACEFGGKTEHYRITAGNMGFDVLLGLSGEQYSFAIDFYSDDCEFISRQDDDLSNFADDLVESIYRIANVDSDFDEDDEDSKAWVEATEDSTDEWERDEIREWLVNELIDFSDGN